jgi:hypothetical protein
MGGGDGWLILTEQTRLIFAERYRLKPHLDRMVTKVWGNE